MGRRSLGSHPRTYRGGPPAERLLGEEVVELESYDALVKIFARYAGEPDEDGNAMK